MFCDSLMQNVSFDHGVLRHLSDLLCPVIQFRYRFVRLKHKMSMFCGRLMQDVSCDFRDFCHIGDLLSSVILFGSRFVCLKHKLKWFLGVFLCSQFFLCFTVRFCAVRIYVDVIKILSVTQNSRSVLCIHYRRFVFKEKNKICRPEQFFSVAMGITTKTRR